MEGSVRCIRMDGNLAPQEHIPRVESRVHLHGRNPRHGSTVHHRVLNRCSTAVQRQQGCVHIDAAMHGDIQNLLRQDLPKCSHHRHVGTEDAQLFGKGRIACARRLKNGNIMRECPRLNRRGAEFLPAPARAIRLRDDSGDIHEIAPLCHRRKNSHGKIRRPHKDGTHRRHSSSSSLRRRTAISMKSRPSR